MRVPTILLFFSFCLTAGCQSNEPTQREESLSYSRVEAPAAEPLPALDLRVHAEGAGTPPDVALANVLYLALRTCAETAMLEPGQGIGVRYSTLDGATSTVLTQEHPDTDAALPSDALQGCVNAAVEAATVETAGAWDVNVNARIPST